MFDPTLSLAAQGWHLQPLRRSLRQKHYKIQYKLAVKPCTCY